MDVKTSPVDIKASPAEIKASPAESKSSLDGKTSDSLKSPYDEKGSEESDGKKQFDKNSRFNPWTRFDHFITDLKLLFVHINVIVIVHLMFIFTIFTVTVRYFFMNNFL